MKLLVDYIRAAGYRTQEELSETLGVRRNTISRWETGKRYPRPPMLPRIAAALNVSEGEIIAAITAARDTA